MLLLHRPRYINIYRSGRRFPGRRGEERSASPIQFSYSAGCRAINEIRVVKSPAEARRYPYIQIPTGDFYPRRMLRDTAALFHLGVAELSDCHVTIVRSFVTNNRKRLKTNGVHSIPISPSRARNANYAKISVFP